MRRPIAALVLTGAVALAVVWEGFRSDAYIPVPGDVPTIGYGTTEGVALGDTITEPVARQRLSKDMERFKSTLQVCIKVPLHQHEFDAIASMTYNIGGRAMCGSTLVRKLNAGDYAGACAQMSKWVYAGGCKLQGLVNRRAEERRVCEGK